MNPGERIEWLACVMALAGILLVTLCCGCERRGSDQPEITADNPELQAIALAAYEALQRTRGLALTGDTELVTVAPERPNGEFSRAQYHNLLGYCTTWPDGHSLIEVSTPYRNHVISHELRHACGEKGLQ